MQNNLGVVKLLLNLQDTAHVLRILVLVDVRLEVGERNGPGGSCGGGVLGREFVKELGEDLVGGHGRVFVVADDDTGDSGRLARGVDVEGEICVFLEMLLNGDP